VGKGYLTIVAVRARMMLCFAVGCNSTVNRVCTAAACIAFNRVLEEETKELDCASRRPLDS
jgi:hypothetical protein